MKKQTFTFLLTMMFALFMGINSASAQMTISKVDPSIFPKAEKGYKKMVIEVPYSDNDANKKIEFSVGKWMDVDGCNTFNLMGTFEQKELQGWGYSYYVFKTNGNVTSTMMACPGKPNRNIFVSAQPELVNYNGRMPIIIYVPDGYDVQFQIFKAENDVYRAAEAK